MKEAELRKHCTCALCGNKIGATGMPLFWRVTIERFGILMPAVQRQTGLAMMLGSASLAGFMGPDEDMAKPMMDAVTISVCETCGVIESPCVAQMAEQARKAEEQPS